MWENIPIVPCPTEDKDRHCCVVLVCLCSKIMQKDFGDSQYKRDQIREGKLNLEICGYMLLFNFAMPKKQLSTVFTSVNKIAKSPKRQN